MDTTVLIIPTGGITCVNDSLFETMVGQLQKFTHKILAIKDGTNLFIWEPKDIPPHLRRESVRPDPHSRVTEYYYRSAEDESLYVFFDPRIDRWLSSGRVGLLQFSAVQESRQQYVLPANSIVMPRQHVSQQPQRPTPVVGSAQHVRGDEASLYGEENSEDDDFELSGRELRMDDNSDAEVQEDVCVYNIQGRR